MSAAETLAVILAMGLVTFATRAGGLWIMAWVPLSPRVEALLRYLAGSVLVAIVAPAVLAGGWSALLAVAVAVVVMRLLPNALVAMTAAIVAAALLRAVVAV